MAKTKTTTSGRRRYFFGRRIDLDRDYGVPLLRHLGDERGIDLTRVWIHERHGATYLSEVTCLPDEEDAIIAWAIRHFGHTPTVPLPVAEYTRRPWGSDYRWTAAANARLLAAVERATEAREARARRGTTPSRSSAAQRVSA